MPPGFLTRRGPVRVQPFFGFRSAERLFINARAVRSREAAFDASGFWRSLTTMLGEYASGAFTGLEVELTYEGAAGGPIRQSAVSGPEGFVRFDLPLDPPRESPPRTRWEKASMRWTSPDSGEPRFVEAHILAPGSQTQMGIISDIDDTILETGITGNLRAIARNWKRVMAQMPGERQVVPGAPSFYAALGGDPLRPDGATAAIGALVPQARVRPVFYVSSSPWNLFAYLVTFKRQRGLPLGPVMLRDWGFNRRTLGREGHGSHKRQSIVRILEAFPHLRFALIGDDTQKDLVAFSSIAAEYPGRIAAVFIRAVSGAPLTPEERAAKAGIEAAGVPLWTGDDYRVAEKFLEGAGLDFEGGVEKLLRTATEGRAADDFGDGSGE